MPLLKVNKVARYKLSCYGVQKKHRLLFLETIHKLCNQLEAVGFTLTYNHRRGSKRSFYDLVIQIDDSITYCTFIIYMKRKFVENMRNVELEIYFNLYTVSHGSLSIKKRYIDVTTKTVKHYEKRNF